MSQKLIDAVLEVEKYKLALPSLEEMVEQGNFTCFFGGSLMIKFDPDKPIAGFEPKPIEDYASDIIRRGQYLVSKIYTKHKEKTCHYYETALSNIEQYERIHGRDRSRQAQMQ